MADTNWIKLNRKIWDSFIWSFDEPKYTLAWIDMLLMANYKDKKIIFDGAFETVARGSFITSIVKLSERWKMNRRTVKRFLDILQQDGMITYQCTRKRTSIRIEKYELYQSFCGGDNYTTESAENDVDECTTDCTGETVENTGFPGFDTSNSAQPNAQLNAHQMHNRMHNECTTDCTQHKKVKKIQEGKEGKESYKRDSSDGERPSPSPSVPYENIKNLYNEICKSFPRCTAMSEARKKAVKARMSSGYTVEHFKTLFTKAEASSFLKGGNNRNWKANFDWLIKDANMAKVLDGNYDDRGMPGGYGQSDYGNPEDFYR